MTNEPARLVGSGEAAHELGVHRNTLLRWWNEGLVSPAKVTAGGQARWIVSDLERQLAQREGRGANEE